MKIIPIHAFTDNYIWTILSEESRSCWVIDPGDHTPVLDYLRMENYSLSGILLTHHHHDHQGGVAQLVQVFPSIPIFGPKDTRMPLVTHTASSGETICIASYNFTVLAIPGHTSSHIAFYAPKEQVLFCGDTLFSAGCGRVFDGTIEQLFHSLLQIKALPDTVSVYCTHEYTKNNLLFARMVEPNNTRIKAALSDIDDQNIVCTLPTSIAREKSINPFLRLQEEEVINFAVANQYKRQALEVFRCLREQKDKF